MKNTLIALGILSSTVALASGDVWLWKDGKYTKNEAIDSITFEDPITVINRQNKGSVPEIYMVDNEFAADGAVIQLAGNFYAEGKDTIGFLSVGFNISEPNANGLDSVIWVDPEGEYVNWIRVTVPEGVKENTFIAVKNQLSGKIGFSQFRLRDTRNMLVDFDNNTDLCYSMGAIKKDSLGNYDVANYSEDWVNGVPSNYNSGKGKKNQFGVFHNADNWESIRFSPDWNVEQDSVRSVFGQAFKKQIMENPALADDFVVKFEMFVDADYPTNFEMLSLGFCKSNEKLSDDYRGYAAALQMSELKWDKSDPEYGWMFESAKDFTTENTDMPRSGWMTITIPLSEFNWNFNNKAYYTNAEAFSKGDFSAIGSDECFGDPDNHLSYAKFYADKLTNDDDLFKYFGGFVICFNPYDGYGNTFETNKNAHVAIDNIRIVPNDGNGAIYPHFKYGVPSQHIDLMPRTEAFTF